MTGASDESEVEGQEAHRGAGAQPRHPLRVGLLTTRVLARWRRDVVAALADSADCELALVVLVPPSPGRETRRGWIGRLYGAVDRRVFRRGPGALDEVDLDDLIRDRPSIEVRLAGGERSIEEFDAGHILTHDLDVLLCLGPEPRGEQAARLARFGAWAYRFGEAGASVVEPVGFREVLGGRPSTPATLNRLGEGPDGEERVLLAATLKTDRLSAGRHGDHLGAVASEFVGRVLHRLRLEGSLDPSPGLVEPGGRADLVPGDAEMAGLIVRFAGRLAAEGWHRATYRDDWALAYSPDGRWEGHRPDLTSMRLLIPPRDRFWADPFPIEVGGATYVFFEDCPYRSRKGHISVLEIDAEGRAGEPRMALERPYHLSYPFVFPWGGELYMIPEATACGDVELYRCSGVPDRWEFDRTLLRGVRGADATLAEHDGLWWLFANIPAAGARNDVEELHLFHAESPLGPWTPHRRNPVKSDVGSSRPAGRLYRRDETWYRPAQDCTLGYGHSIVLNRVETWDLRDYSEVPAGRIDPDWSPGLDRTHTFNALGPLFVVDARIARPRLNLGKPR